jgi:sodium-dependent dicarboxylate transporter 2/3/5
VFLLTATLWVFSSQIEALLARQIDDAMIAIFGALLLFVIPTRRNFEQFPLEWKDMQKLPWGMLIFFGGALSIADALTQLGVTRWLSSELSALNGMSLIMVVLIITIIIIAVSEMMSNIATITAFLPIISALSAALNINPLLIAVPATLAASCAFMLPGASAPNAIAFGTGHLSVKDMVKNGFWLDIFSIAVILISTFTLVAWALGIDVSVRPDWASGK